jgi:hypothetical protein
MMFVSALHKICSPVRFGRPVQEAYIRCPKRREIVPPYVPPHSHLVTTPPPIINIVF